MLQDLICDAFSMYGIDVLYIPRNMGNYDQLYVADDQSTYTQTIPVDVYLLTVDGFGGDQNIFTKFGLEIRDQITVSMAFREYERKIKPNTNQPRPMEGDLLYFVLNKKCFQIKFVNNKELFYELGKLPTFKLTCELFEYSDEKFDTGVPEIDAIQKNLSLNILDNTVDTESVNILTTEDGSPIIIEKFNLGNIEPTAGNDILKKEDQKIVSWSEKNPWGEITDD
jgi:hypothetical protein